MLYFCSRSINNIVLQVRYAGNQSSRKAESKSAATKAAPESTAKPPPPATQPSAAADPAAVAALEQRVAEQGNRVRDMKAAKAGKQEITDAVAELLSLKKQLCVAQGIDPASLDKKGKKK